MQPNPKKIWIVIGGVLLLIVGAIFLLSTLPDGTGEDVISSKGLHWHSQLKIVIDGQEQPIPEGIGLAGSVHNPIHTHDGTGEVHMEFSGTVKKSDLALGKLFVLWGKDFSQNCIFDKCNGAEGRVKMLVNGEESMEFEKYEMKDKDKIEIRFER